ncbi:hypothetical protein C8R43DRAFT_1244568 [Mycena crocata]|nr:hypothetical protein C8R43DRAFT_1244568 [Mycena crocata]
MPPLCSCKIRPPTWRSRHNFFTLLLGELGRILLTWMGVFWMAVDDSTLSSTQQLTANNIDIASWPEPSTYDSTPVVLDILDINKISTFSILYKLSSSNFIAAALTHILDIYALCS